MLGIEFRQLQRSIHARLELGDLLVHGDALDRETLRGIGIANFFEALDGFGAVAEAGVEIADRVVDGEIVVIVSCRILSYSAMAFCSLPCWTNFSAALRTFCLLKPKPNAIGFADSSLISRRTPAHFRQRRRTGSDLRREIPRRNPANRATGIAE